MGDLDYHLNIHYPNYLDESDVPPLIPVSNVGVTAAKPIFTLKINAKPNNNSADKSNFRLILPPPGMKSN